MSNSHRTGIKSARSSRPQRRYELGNYRIITDTDETEKLYFEGLKNSLPIELQNRIDIVVLTKVDTKKLISKARDIIGDYSDTWIVFDRDKVPNFDKILKEADENDINVAWSNPCIEIWFLAYFGTMPNGLDSVKCCKKFEETFKKESALTYHKNDKRIYNKLIKYGDESVALKIAKQKYTKWIKQCKQVEDVPYSEMNACTLMFSIVGEIRSRVADSTRNSDA